MGSDMQDDDASEAKLGNRATLIVIAIGIAALMFLLDDVVGWVDGGGLFSIVAASQAVASKARIIDVDSDGLRTLFVIGCGFAVVAVCLLISHYIRSRLPFTLIIILIAGSGFILDAVFDGGIVTGYMASHGYSRCKARDHHVGSGKSEVWFHDYVRNPADCRPSNS